MGLSFDSDALASIPQRDAPRLKAKIDWLWTNRHVVNHFPLSENLSGLYKRRLGQYRIIYSFEANPDDMVIHRVGLRNDIYQIPL